MYIDSNGLLAHYYGPSGKVVLPAATKELAPELFQYRKDIHEVVMNNGLENIGIRTFCGSGLTKAHIPDSVDWISIAAFALCEELREVRLPKWLSTVDIEVFYDCGKLEKVILPQYLAEIEQDAFARCENLQEIDLPSTLESIGARSFERTGLKKIVIPASVMMIEHEAFTECRELSIAVIEGDMITIAEEAFPQWTVIQAPHIPPENLPGCNQLMAVVGFAEWCAAGGKPSRHIALCYRFFLRTHAKELCRLTADHPALAERMVEEGLIPPELVEKLRGDTLNAVEALYAHITENF